MPTLLLVRHGVTEANRAGTLAGRTAVGLSDTGREQAAALAGRLRPVPLAAIVTSPLPRCRQTAQALAEGRGVAVEDDDRLAEVDYGEWTGGELKTLARKRLWRVVQTHPSAARFPAGESLRETAARAVAAVRERNERLDDRAVWVAVSHGDVIKAVLADALGLHLDLFQRIVVDPGSLSVIRYTELRPFVLRVNDIGGDLAGVVPSKRRRRRADAAIGGGAGAAEV